MNKAKLKTYAPAARRDFIQAVTHRAHLLGLTESGTAPAEVVGDTVLIAGKAWPKKLAAPRDKLAARIRRDGFGETMEAVAYTWFNHFAALRYMELHGFLDHGYRVLSNRAGGLPEILDHAAELDLPGLSRQQVIDLKLAGDQDNALYRLLLIAQCNALAKAMPFLFERIDDETELLLPDNLLHTDSVVAKLVSEIPEEDWQQVEIIGWLYQFYIREKKDQVIGKVVRSEDIPAATQLFTPNWIVQYLVQNSVGRLWLMANPGSPLASQWPYYIQPAEQTPEVNVQLDALIQARMDEDGGSLNPETITVLDPACGSGHILVVAYDVLKGIYLERGYRLRDIPRLILEKNLYGLDIDDRAAQLAGFALLMKAREDDRRLLEEPPRLNVLAIQESKGLDANELATHLAPFGLEHASLKTLLDTFEHAKTFGSLIQIPAELNAQLESMTAGLQQALKSGDLFAQQAATDVMPLVWQALILGMQFDAVVANPPYMGYRYCIASLKRFIDQNYSMVKSDLYACFMFRNALLCKDRGIVGMITIPNWMFLQSFVDLRNWLLDNNSIETFLHNGRGVFGSDFGSCAFTFGMHADLSLKGQYKRLFEKSGSVASNEELDSRFVVARLFQASGADFKKIPGSPIAYWVKNYDVFLGRKFQEHSLSGGRTKSHNDELYVRYWWEVLKSQINGRWVWFEKGGDFRKWYGNRYHIINWGQRALAFYEKNGGLCNQALWWKPGITWSRVTSAESSFRYKENVSQYGSVAPTILFHNDTDLYAALGVLNSRASFHFTKVLNPTIDLNVGDVLNFPSPCVDPDNHSIVARCISIARTDWNSFEIGYGFDANPLLVETNDPSLECSWNQYRDKLEGNICSMKLLEEENNKKVIKAYGLQDELSPEVPEDQITLARADREKDCQRLISYAIGCMMGRYSLDEPGLIYAHACNVDFDPSRYEKKFPADADGIIPITDECWFDDDAAQRICEFLRAVWGPETLGENMDWLAESLGKKGGETPDETIRRYLADKFFKDHLQTYKKRPIYWLFSSGKQGAFQALVYLHRYNEGTLARMRNAYVIPLTGKIAGRIDLLEQEVANASSTSARTKAQKALDAMRRKQAELVAYDEQLRHYADMRIQLDLDDGVKVNYGKFGNLLAEVKAVTGGGGDD